MSQVTSSSPLTESTVAYVKSDGSNKLWGQANTTIRAPIEDVLAFLWNSKARNQAKADTIEKTYLEEPNKHNRLEYVVKKLPSPLVERDFCSRNIWKQEQDGTIYFSSIPTPLPATVPVTARHDITIIRGTLKSVYRLVKSRFIDDVVAQITLQLYTGATVPKIIVELYTCYNLRRITYAQQYFQQLRELRDYDEKDGIAIGESFMLKTKIEAEASSFKHEVREGW